MKTTIMTQLDSLVTIVKLAAAGSPIDLAAFTKAVLDLDAMVVAAVGFPNVAVPLVADRFQFTVARSRVFTSTDVTAPDRVAAALIVAEQTRSSLFSIASIKARADTLVGPALAVLRTLFVQTGTPTAPGRSWPLFGTGAAPVLRVHPMIAARLLEHLKDATDFEWAPISSRDLSNLYTSSSVFDYFWSGMDVASAAVDARMMSPQGTTPARTPGSGRDSSLTPTQQVTILQRQPDAAAARTPGATPRGRGAVVTRQSARLRRK